MYGAERLPALLPALQRVADNSRDNQAVAAEAFAGLVRGAGRWPLGAQQALWASLAPRCDAPRMHRPIARRLAGLPALLLCHRDPRRVGWPRAPRRGGRAIDQRNRLGRRGGRRRRHHHHRGGGGARRVARGALAHQANHLRFLAPIVVELGWKGLPLLRLLRGELMRGWVSHPYRQVREEVGSLLAIALDVHAAAQGRAVRAHPRGDRGGDRGLLGGAPRRVPRA